MLGLMIYEVGRQTTSPEAHRGRLSPATSRSLLPVTSSLFTMNIEPCTAERLLKTSITAWRKPLSRREVSMSQIEAEAKVQQRKALDSVSVFFALHLIPGRADGSCICFCCISEHDRV